MGWTGPGNNSKARLRRLSDDLVHFKWLFPFLKDEWSFRIADKLIFLVYRPGGLPDPGRTLACGGKWPWLPACKGYLPLRSRHFLLTSKKIGALSGFDGESFSSRISLLFTISKCQNGKNKQTGANDATIVDYHDIWQLLAKDSVETEKRGKCYFSRSRVDNAARIKRTS